MKIEKTTRTFSFGDVRIGDTFEYEDDIYIKVGGCPADMYVNAIMLRSGSFCCLEDDDKVIPVDGKFVVYQNG